MIHRRRFRQVLSCNFVLELITMNKKIISILHAYILFDDKNEIDDNTQNS